MLAWKTLASVETKDGLLELRQRGERDYLITIAKRVLMTSAAHRSEIALAELSCRPIAKRAKASVLIGGLGMGYTLKAALDTLGKDATVTVAELTPEVVAWCQNELAELTDSSANDPRVTIKVADVSKVIAVAKGAYDAIILDLYEGPHETSKDPGNSFYSTKALQRTARALKSGGVFAVWGEERDRAFENRLTAAGFNFSVEHHGVGGRKHPVYLAQI